MLEKDEFQNLELWIIIAFYMENAGSNGCSLKDIVSNLNFEIKYKKPLYRDLADTKLANRIKGDILERSSKFIKKKSKWELLAKQWELWKKDNKDKCELYDEFMKFCKENKEVKSTLKTEETAVLNMAKIFSNKDKKAEKEFFNNIREKLKENILCQCKKNNIYILGQLVFNNQEYNLLCKYAKYCVHKKMYAIKEDIVLWTAFVKIIQEKAESTIDPWKTIYRELNFQTVSQKQENFIYAKREDVFKKTLSHYNKEESLNLYYASENNRNLIIAHAFILKKQIHEYCSILIENKNLTLDNVIKFINKSKLSKYSKNIVNDSSGEQLECLLGKQLAYMQNQDTNLCKIDYFVNKLSSYIVNPDKYANRQNYIIKPGKKDNPPYLTYKNNDVYIHIPTQSIEKEVNISIVFSNNEKIEQMAYLYNDSLDIKIDKKYIKNIFDEIRIFFNGYCPHNPILGKPYRFFENNGREKLNIASIERNPAILYTQKNVQVEDADFIREETNEEYKQYLVSLKDRSKHIEIDRTLFYLNTIEKSDLELELTKIDYIEGVTDIGYSIIPPKIIIRGDNDMRTANLSIINRISGKLIGLNFDEAQRIHSEDNNNIIYIFDLNDLRPDFFENDNLYKVEYNNKNKTLTKEFVLIDSISVKFEKELYLIENEIPFSFETSYEINDGLEYWYKYIDNQSNYKDRPIKIEIPLQNEKIYSLWVDFPIASLKLVRNIDNILIEKEDFIYELDLEKEFELDLPNSIELKSTPALVVDGKIYYFRNNNGKYTIEKNKIIENDNDKPYKKNLKLYIQTNNAEYKVDIGTIYNRPVGKISVYENKNGITIETNYEDYLPKFSNINMEISNIEDFQDWEIELPSDRVDIFESQLKENTTYTITTYTNIDVKNVLDVIEYKYLPSNRINQDDVKIDSIITSDNMKRTVEYYSINDIEYIDKDLYKGQVNYCKDAFTYKPLCELYFKINKKGNEYIILPQEECKLSYLKPKNKNYWILTSLDNVKSNVLSIICK